jgi:hypothetical protein
MMVITPPSHQHLLRTQSKATFPPTTRRVLPLQVTQRIVTQQAMNVLTIKKKAIFNAMFMPHDLMQHAVTPFTHHFEHYANPMVHPVTGEMISSCKKLMNDPATAEIWQTALGKDFGGMAQGNNKACQKGTNTMFVMTHKKYNNQQVL